MSLLDERKLQVSFHVRKGELRYRRTVVLHLDRSPKVLVRYGFAFSSQLGLDQQKGRVLHFIRLKGLSGYRTLTHVILISNPPGSPLEKGGTS